MKEIGGYFGLETPGRYDFPHDKGVLLNSGRSALRYLLLSLGDVRRVWIPYYTCHTVADVVDGLGIKRSFYHVNEQLEIADHIRLAEGEYVIATNYFGLKDDYIATLPKEYGGHLIVDNAQAWYAAPLDGVPTLYSPRKYVGVPDGGIACNPGPHAVCEECPTDTSYDRCAHLLLRHDLGAAAGYGAFHDDSRLLAEAGMRRMSRLTQTLLQSVDYERVRSKRLRNFQTLDSALSSSNRLDMERIGMGRCPLIYPYLPADGNLRSTMIDHKVFCATYWPNVLQWCADDALEHQLAGSIVALPIDQRYGEEDMKRIVSITGNKTKANMEHRVYLRAFEPDDYKTTIEWRNDDEINSKLGGGKTLCVRDLRSKVGTRCHIPLRRREACHLSRGQRTAHRQRVYDRY